MYYITFLLNVCVCEKESLTDRPSAKKCFFSSLHLSLSLLCRCATHFSIWQMFNVCLWVQRLFYNTVCCTRYTHSVHTVHTCNKVIWFLWPVLSFIRTFAHMHAQLNSKHGQPTKPSSNFISLDRMSILHSAIIYKRRSVPIKLLFKDVDDFCGDGWSRRRWNFPQYILYVQWLIVILSAK